MFTRYIQTVTDKTLVRLLDMVQGSALDLICDELQARRDGKSPFINPVTVWVYNEVENIWENQEVTYNQAKELAFDAELECRNCWGIVDIVEDYIITKGYCKNCKWVVKENV